MIVNFGAKIQIVPMGGMISSNSRVGVHDSRGADNSMTGMRNQGRADNSVTGMSDLRNHGRADNSGGGNNSGCADNSGRADFLNNGFDGLSNGCGCVKWNSGRTGLSIVGHNSVESVLSVSSIGHLQK